MSLSCEVVGSQLGATAAREAAEERAFPTRCQALKVARRRTWALQRGQRCATRELAQHKGMRVVAHMLVRAVHVAAGGQRAAVHWRNGNAALWPTRQRFLGYYRRGGWGSCCILSPRGGDGAISDDWMAGLCEHAHLAPARGGHGAGPCLPACLPACIGVHMHLDMEQVPARLRPSIPHVTWSNAAPCLCDPWARAVHRDDMAPYSHIRTARVCTFVLHEYARACSCATQVRRVTAGSASGPVQSSVQHLTQPSLRYSEGGGRGHEGGAGSGESSVLNQPSLRCVRGEGRRT